MRLSVQVVVPSTSLVNGQRRVWWGLHSTSIAHYVAVQTKLTEQTAYGSRTALKRKSSVTLLEFLSYHPAYPRRMRRLIGVDEIGNGGLGHRITTKLQRGCFSGKSEREIDGGDSKPFGIVIDVLDGSFILL